MSEDICACVSELICHYFGGALFLYTLPECFYRLQKCKDIVQYKNKTSKRTVT